MFSYEAEVFRYEAEMFRFEAEVFCSESPYYPPQRGGTKGKNITERLLCEFLNI